MIFGTDYNAVDIAALLLIVLEIILGFRRGMAGTLFRLACTVIMLLSGLRFYQLFGDLLARNTELLAGNPELAGALAFLLIIVVLGLFFLLVRILLNLLMTVAFNEKINRKGGGLAGLLQGLVLVFLVVYAVGLWPAAATHQLFAQHSIVGRAVFRMCPRMISAVERVEFRGMPELAPANKSEKE